MPKQIVIIGCSWSKDGTWHGYKWEPGKTYCWPELLAQDLGEDWQVINVSMNGSSNAMILHLTERLLRDFDDADLFVLQFTRPLRVTFTKSWQHLSDLSNWDNLRTSAHGDHTPSTYRELPYYQGSDAWEYNEVGFMPAWPGKLSQKGSGIMKTVYEHMLLHDSFHQKISDKIGQEALMRQAILLCNRANMPVVAYSHAYYELMNSDMLDFVVQRDFIEMEDYCVDNGLHLNTQGNRILVDRFIRPCIDTKISV